MNRAVLLILLFASTGCAPCGFDSAIVSGEVTDQAGEPLGGGLVQLIPSDGATEEVGIFGDGRYEASVLAGSYEVVAYDADEQCYSEIHPIEVEGCDELTVNLQLVDCFR